MSGKEDIELNPKQKKFADLYIKTGDKLKSYIEVYGSDNEQSINANSTRLIKNDNIKQYIKEQRKAINEATSAQVRAEVIAKEVETLMTAIEKRALLAKIARGEQDIPDVINTKYGVEYILRKPTATERIKAIDTDNKMSGDNMPIKQAYTDSQGNDIPLLEKFIKEGADIKTDGK